MDDDRRRVLVGVELFHAYLGSIMSLCVFVDLIGKGGRSVVALQCLPIHH